MHIPKAYLSLHEITGLKATNGPGPDRPLILTVDGAHGSMQITLFLQPLLTVDQLEKLVEAMNATLRATEPPSLPDPAEKAAYAAHDDYWERLSIDLNRHPIEKAAS